MALPNVVASAVTEVDGVGWSVELDRLHARFAGGLTRGMNLEMVRKSAEQHGFAVHPRHLVFERTLAWLTAHRRLARDQQFEHVIWAAAINGMLARLTCGSATIRHQRYDVD